MKKGIKLGTAAILAVSALTPVAAFAAESTVADGIYTSYGEGFYSASNFTKLTPEVKKAIFKDAKSAIVSGGTVYNLQSDIAMKSDAAIDAITTTVEQYEADKGVSFDSGKGFDEAPVAGLKVESVSAINGTVTVTFDKDVTEVPEGLSVEKDGEALELSADAFSVVDGKIAITVPKVEAPEEGVTEVTYAVTLGETTKEVTLKVTAMTELEPTQEEKALQAAEAAVSAFEAKVNTAELAEELVANRDKREEVAASFTPAANKIQEVKGEQKQALLDRLDAANDVVIAAGSVSSLQAATADLTEETFADAKSQLTKTQNLLNHVAEGTVKDALQALVTAESDKIDALQADLDEAAKVAKAIADAEAAIADLPEIITLADKQDVLDARALVVAALELDENAEITGLDTLEAAETTIADLEAEEEAQEKLAAAKTAAEEAVTALPTVEDLTLDDEEAVDAARQLVADYVDLGGEETDIENLSALEAVEDQIEALHTQAEFNALLADAQEKVDALTLATSSLTKLDTQEKVDNALALSTTATSAIEAVIASNEDYDVSALAIAKDEANEMITEALKVLEAKDLVKTAQETKLDADFNAAKAKVDALKSSDAKTVENAKLIELAAERKAIVDAVNASVEANNDIALDEALATGPFNYDTDKVSAYRAALAGGKDSITEIQTVIDQVNENATEEALAELVDAAKRAVTAVVEEGDFATTNSEDQEAFDALVTAAQTAIDALPADYTEEDAEAPLAELLQAQLDAEKKLNADFVNLVNPINNAATAENQIQLNKALNAAEIKAVNTSYIQEYINAIKAANTTTVKDVQEAVWVVNAEQAIEGLTGEGLTQDNIDAAQALVDTLVEAGIELTDTDEDGTSDLQAGINDAQEALNEAEADSAALAAAKEAGAAAQAAYEAASGDVEETVYTDLTAALEGEDAGAITTTTEALEAATITITELKAAKEAGAAAQAAYEAAGGDVEETVYTDLTTALEDAVAITTATEALEAATEEILSVKAINDAIAADDAAALQAIIVNYGVEDAEAYYNLSKAQRAEFVNYLVANIETPVESTTAFKNAIPTQAAAYLAEIKAVNDATTTSAMVTALNVVSEAYKALPAQTKLTIADTLVDNVTAEGFAGYKMIAQIEDAIQVATPAQ